MTRGRAAWGRVARRGRGAGWGGLCGCTFLGGDAARTELAVPWEEARLEARSGGTRRARGGYGAGGGCHAGRGVAGGARMVDVKSWTKTCKGTRGEMKEGRETLMKEYNNLRILYPYYGPPSAKSSSCWMEYSNIFSLN